MAHLLAIQATIDPQSPEDLRDGTRFPNTDRVIPMYMRGVEQGAVTIDGMRTGAHTICIVLGDPRVPTSAKLRCTQVTLTAAPKQTAAVVVPAAWLDAVTQ
jgi:hypothetical protein